ncbi:MAG: hypothetical protein ABIH63_00845 [archaeon]
MIGVLPLLKFVNIVIPGLDTLDMNIYDLIVRVALFVGGIFLLYDSFAIRNMLTGRVKGTSILAGFLLAVIGAIPLALHLKLLSFLPFIVALSIPSVVLYSLLVFYGVYLVVDAYLVRATRFF